MVHLPSDDILVIAPAAPHPRAGWVPGSGGLTLLQCHGRRAQWGEEERKLWAAAGWLWCDPGCRWGQDRGQCDLAAGDHILATGEHRGSVGATSGLGWSSPAHSCLRDDYM